MINYDDFSKLDLRTAKIISAERVEGSDKLIRLQLDVGELGERQIVAGIGKAYQPEQLIGRQIVIIANLESRKFTLRHDSGQVVLESNGMLLAASTDDKGPVLLVPGGDIEPGAKIK